MPDIDEETLGRLNAAYALVQKLNGDTRTRPMLEEAIKVHIPNVLTEREIMAAQVNPHLETFRNEVVTPIQDELKAMREEREARSRETTEAQLNDAFGRMRTERGFTDEGIEAVKRLMVDRSIADPMAAAALFAEQNPRPSNEQPGWTPSHWNIEQNVTDFDVKGLFANEDAWADNMAAKTLNEIRLGVAA